MVEAEHVGDEKIVFTNPWLLMPSELGDGGADVAAENLIHMPDIKGLQSVVERVVTVGYWLAIFPTTAVHCSSE
jgi:hypothetical protein